MGNQETITPFSIIPRVYEAPLDKKYGIILGNLSNGNKSKFQGNLEKNISFNEGLSPSPQKIEEKILKKHKSIPGFSSMIIKNEANLNRHIENIHELSYNHYVFGKETNMKRTFPDMCCGRSSSNLFLSLMEKGYLNSSFFYNDCQDHAYVGLPFLFGKNKEKGFIIIDPTSDQLFNNKKNAPRNNLFIVSGDKWKYETDWKDGENLYPGEKDNSKFSNLDTLRNHPGEKIYESYGMNKYFKQVFENTIKLKIKSF
ncbi:hypothetical protein HOD29_05650 [archaeon]|jgi:hypothetical protein|nr:hypothetical protein [archaeon]